jgi:hypothetical protein
MWNTKLNLWNVYYLNWLSLKIHQYTPISAHHFTLPFYSKWIKSTPARLCYTTLLVTFNMSQITYFMRRVGAKTHVKCTVSCMSLFYNVQYEYLQRLIIPPPSIHITCSSLVCAKWIYSKHAALLYNIW